MRRRGIEVTGRCVCPTAAALTGDSNLKVTHTDLVSALHVVAVAPCCVPGPVFELVESISFLDSRLKRNALPRQPTCRLGCGPV